MAEADRKCSETRGIYDEILAEMVVRECMDTVANCKGTTKFDHWSAIKEHFGVEE